MLSPSPWSVSDKEIYIRDQDGWQVCLMGPLSTVEDARLISAAPQLLAALKVLLDEAPEATEPYEPYDLAIAAIAKAEGRS